MTSGMRLGTWALLAILIAAGCAIQIEVVNPTPASPAAEGSQGGSALYAPQPSSLEDAPPATPSPTTPTPSPTVSLRSSPGPRPTITPSPSPTVTLAASPTPTPMPTLRQLTQGGCCTQPFWSPDSRRVLFIDKPGLELPAGIWGVDVIRPQATPELVTERVAFYSPDLTLRSELNEDTTLIERLGDPLSETESPSGAEGSPEETWEVPAGGRPVSISPGQKRIAWQISDDDLPFERRMTQIWIANLDGSAPQMVANLPRGGLSGWISDDLLLLSGRESLEAQEQILFTLSLTDGSWVELARGERLRGGLLSPDGAWLVYFVALDKDPAENGLWLVRSDGSERRKLERELFGAYHWRDARRLLIIPFQPQATSHELWELDLDTGGTRRLIDPEVIPFKIANGDWAVSPDGRYVVFVESSDRNIWLLTLPD